MTGLTITPLHPSLGAEVSGLDLHAPIDDDARAALGAALSEHLALVFRDQTFTEPEYMAVTLPLTEPTTITHRIQPT